MSDSSPYVSPIFRAVMPRYFTDEVNGVTFSGDVADAPISHFAKIKASLVDPPHHPAHLSFESWTKVYRCENRHKPSRANYLIFRKA